MRRVIEGRLALNPAPPRLQHRLGVHLDLRTSSNSYFGEAFFFGRLSCIFWHTDTLTQQRITTAAEDNFLTCVFFLEKAVLSRSRRINFIRRL